MRIATVRRISYQAARAVVAKYHYAKVMPRITKFCIGGFDKDDRLVAVCTLGYGVRPLHTIKKIFPNLDVKDYLELGRLCVADECPRNSESWFISRVIKMIRQLFPQVLLLYSWSDGIIGKPGYVYQASNFFYGGYIWTEMYLDRDGNRVHPRTLQGISTGEKVGKFKSRAYEVTERMGYRKYFGRQFRYVFPLCSNRRWKEVRKGSTISWERKGYPKDKDCEWFKQVKKGQRERCELPPFVVTQKPKQVTAQQELLLIGARK